MGGGGLWKTAWGSHGTEQQVQRPLPPSRPCRTPLLQSLIGLFELPEDDTIPDEEHFIDIEDTPGYQTAFSQLAFAGRKEHDPVGQMVNNPKIHLAQSLHKLSTACPGRVSISVVRGQRCWRQPDGPCFFPVRCF